MVSDSIYRMYIAFLSRDFIARKCIYIETIPETGEIILTENVPHSHFKQYYFAEDGSWKKRG